MRGSEAAALDETRSRRVKASLKRLLLANQTFTLALKVGQRGGGGVPAYLFQE